MKLSQRMVRTFCNNISSSGAPSWTALSDSSGDTVRVTSRKNMEPGQPNDVILCAVSTTWLPYSANQVFELLTNEKRRSQVTYDIALFIYLFQRAIFAKAFYFSWMFFPGGITCRKWLTSLTDRTSETVSLSSVSM